MWMLKYMSMSHGQLRTELVRLYDPRYVLREPDREARALFIHHELGMRTRP